jgi:NAD(P)-dependent dehydrogenase (short-subunit alcohol dehydrogenase family)
MSDGLSFEGRVVIVTGAGGGLGRAHALALAARGAAVLVNDLGGSVSGQGGSVSGQGGSTRAAQQVVEEISAQGGRAVASFDDIATEQGAQALADAAVKAFGRIDALINNAGFLRDKSLVKMDPADFEAVVRVHLLGSALCTRAVWPVLQARQYGRIVMTTSAAGLYGNFGQSNYAAAKMGLIGLMNTLKDEGERHGIKVNAVAPVALTRMTQGLTLAQWMAQASPEKVSAAVVYLASQACQGSGQIVAAGANHFAGVQVVEGLGVVAPQGQVTPEFVAANWARIQDMNGARSFANATQALVQTFGPGSA